jgi:DNA-binding NarL/FixJ family response regulator
VQPVTDRQLDVVRAYVSTTTVKGAAASLGVSPRTVKRNLAAVRCRLGVETTTQAVVILAIRGYLGSDAAA